MYFKVYKTFEYCLWRSLKNFVSDNIFPLISFSRAFVLTPDNIGFLKISSKDNISPSTAHKKQTN